MTDELTRPTLLFRLKDRDQGAWEEFVELYTPMLYGYCTRRGLSEADAADVVQEMMRSISMAMDRFDYDRGKGKFRSWLFTVAHSKLCRFFKTKGRRPSTAGDTRMMEFINEQPSEEEERDWDLGYKRRLFQWAAERVKKRVAPNTWEAFWRVSMNEEPVEEVVEALGMSTGSVYVAKSRVIVALRQELESIDGVGVGAGEIMG